MSTLTFVGRHMLSRPAAVAARLARGAHTLGAREAREMLESGSHKGNKYTYATEVPVRWIDMDSMGHVNNGTFFTYFEQVRCEHFDAVGLVIGGGAPEGPIIAETTCKFRAPVVHGDVLTVGSMCEKVDNTSWLQKYAIVSHASGRVVAEGSASLVWFDYQRGQRKTFSEDAERKLFGE